MPSCGVCACACLCVCVFVSVTFVDCVKTNNDIFEIFTPSGSHTILVFPHQTGWRYSYGNPPPITGASNVGRNLDSEHACCWRCNKRGVVNMVDGGTRLPSRKLWHLYRWSYTAGKPIRPPTATRDSHRLRGSIARATKRAFAVRTIHNHDRSCVWQQGLTLRRRQHNRIELYALVNPKLK